MPLFAPPNTPITDWHGRRVWLVGASSGIGAALARALAARGARVAISARSADKLAQVAAECPGSLAAPLDFTDAAATARVCKQLLFDWGGIDLVVFCAGTYRPLRAWELTAEAIRETLEVNLFGTMNGVAAVLPGMLGQKSGAIALVASVAGYAGLPRALVYGPSKAALINFAEILHMDLAPRRVSVFLINPGFVDTPLTAQNDFRMPALITPEAAAAAIIEGFARGRFEIHFPRRFTWLMKCLARLPRCIYFPLVRRSTGL
jgi:short-subunit dehydrogenase